MSRLLLVLGLIAALAAAGCGSSPGSGSSTPTKTVDPNAKEVSPAGDIPDNQAFVRYRPPGATYSIEVPEGWSRTESGGAVVYTDKLNSIRLESQPAAGPMTTAEAAAKGKATTVTRPAGQAVRVVYAVTSAPDAVTGRTVADTVERYVFFHNGRRAIITLTAPKGADNVDPWKRVTGSLRWAR